MAGNSELRKSIFSSTVSFDNKSSTRFSTGIDSLRHNSSLLTSAAVKYVTEVKENNPTNRFNFNEFFIQKEINIITYANQYLIP